MHKDRRLLPMWMTVTKVSGIGEDTMFLGVAEAIPIPQDTVTVWVTTTGNIMSACTNFQVGCCTACFCAVLPDTIFICTASSCTALSLL